MLTYEGDGFLYHMVRIITGTLIEVGRGTRTPKSVVKLLDKDASREMAGHLYQQKDCALWRCDIKLR